MTETIKNKIMDAFRRGTLTSDELAHELEQLEAAGVANGLGVPFLYTPYGCNDDDDDPFVYDASRMTLDDYVLRQQMLQGAET